MLEQNLNCASLDAAKRTDCLAKAFEAGAGVSPTNLNEAIGMIILMAVFLWVAWLTFSQYQSFASGDITFYDLIWRVVRGVIVLLLFTLILKM